MPFLGDVLKVRNIRVKLDQGHYGKYTRGALEPVEPFVPWQLRFLTVRDGCYKAVNSPLSAQATRDLSDFFAHEPSRMTVVPPPGKSTPGGEGHLTAPPPP